MTEPLRRRGRGEHAIYWDKHKSCYVAAVSLGYTAAGRRRRRKVTGRTKTEVRDKLKDLRTEIESGVQSSARHTVAEAVNSWLAGGLRDRAQGTHEKYRILTDTHIIPELGARKLRELTADDLDGWLDTKAEQLATRTLRELLSILRRSIKHAQRRDLVIRNVAELVTAPGGKGGRPSQSLTVNQASALLAASVGTRLHAYVALSLMSGIRTEEVRALKWDRVHLDQEGDMPPHVEVWRSVRESGDTKTKKSRRTLGLPSPAVEALKAHRARQSAERLAVGRAWVDNDLVFCTQLGTPLDAANVRREFRKVTESAGLGEEWSPRELRHTFVSVLSAYGVPDEAISRLVGHSSNATTQTVYRKELRPVLTEGAEVMEKIFGKSAG